MFVPTGKTEPDGGVQVTVAPQVVPLVAGAAYVTTASHRFGVLILVTVPGQTIVQPVELTVTVKAHVALFSDPSSAVHETVVVPTKKTDPDAGEQLVVTPEQLSLAVGDG
jgi:hypothetical protein